MSDAEPITFDESELAAAPDMWLIEPRGAGLVQRARELWRYRRLLKYFAVRSVERGVRRTILGHWWLLIRPLFPLMVSAIVFGRVLRVDSGGVPYFLFLVVGTAAWDLFESAVMWATRSLDMNRGLISKFYVPRSLLPVASVTPALVSFLVYVGVIALATAYYWFTSGKIYLTFRPDTLWALAALLCTLVFAMGIGFWTAFPALVARDVRFTLAYVLGFWVFLTPVVYPLTQIPERWRWLVMLNPMAAYVEMFKWGVLGIGGVHARETAIALAITAAVVGSGLWFFDRSEAEAADKA
jgi:lipopolysaccharide transport system permease protein